jgi:8-oxo-dGTP pyrophosphatase MutT (NUDIX family)
MLLNMNEFVKRLKAEILKGLPGTEVQWEMASSDRMLKGFPRVPGKDARMAAVLILLYPDNGTIHTVLLQRQEYIGVHGGQISLPGGKQELSDKNTIQTALRETKEETGTDTEGIFVAGTLTPLFIPVSNMLVTPVAGWLDNKPVFNIRQEEVAFLIDCEIKRLLDPSIIKTGPFEINGEMLDIKYFDYAGHVIWGATAMILHELLTIIKRANISPDYF